MKKKQHRVLKLSRETLRTLSEHVLGDAHGGVPTVICTVKCASGTICSCGQTELCSETCHTVSEFQGCTQFCTDYC